MFSLQRFICRDEKFFDLIEALGRSSTTCVKTLAEILLEPEKPAAVDEIVRLRKESKEHNDAIAHELCVSFVTPLEREDIEALSTALLRISKTSGKFASQYCVFSGAIRREDFKKQSEFITQSAEVLSDMVMQLRHKPDVKLIKELNNKLRYYEGETDRILLTLLEQLYSDTNQPIVTVIATKSLQELLEKLTDRIREAGNIVFRIVLKYS